MFIYSIRASTVKIIGFVLLAVALIGCIALSGDNAAVMAAGSGEIDYSNVKTNEQRVAFIEGFGIQVDDTPTEEQAFTMPKDFDRVILGYNELQKKQGLDRTIIQALKQY